MAVKTTYFFGSYSSAPTFRPFIIQINSRADGTFTIPTTGGGYNYEVSTSDGQNFSGVTGNLTITFTDANTLYDISISGDFPRIYFNNGTQRLKLIDIKQWGDIEWTSMLRAFYGCSNTTCTATDIPNFSSVTNTGYMFSNCSSLVTLDVSQWGLSSVVNASYMFQQCTSLVTLDVSSWNVSSLTTTEQMFQNCFLLTTLDVSSWNVSSLTTAERMFYNCYLWDNNLNGLNVSSLVNAREMFRYSGFTNQGTTLDWSNSTTGSINLEDAHAFAYNTGLLGYKLQAGNIILSTNNNFTNSATLTELIGMKTSFYIADAPITGTAIDNLFTSLGTANTGATITITTAQSTSGIDTTIATAKGWTIVII